jgi:GNAT superfamily N-acetyltransferase
MADASVRPASAGDAAAIARVQAAAWSATFAGVLPDALLAGLDGPAAVAAWAAAAEPPSSRHLLLVALDGTSVVGFAAVTPSEDPDLADDAAEVQAFCVDPAAQGTGHGSRLVNAVADTLRDRGVDLVAAWVTEAETDLRRFLESAGWAGDGAARAVDLHGDGTVVLAQARLVAGLHGTA